MDLKNELVRLEHQQQIEQKLHEIYIKTKRERIEQIERKLEELNVECHPNNR